MLKFLKKLFAGKRRQQTYLAAKPRTPKQDLLESAEYFDRCASELTEDIENYSDKLAEARHERARAWSMAGSFRVAANKLEA
jgi:hypothetical protein